MRFCFAWRIEGMERSRTSVWIEKSSSERGQAGARCVVSTGQLIVGLLDVEGGGAVFT
jgi:hypothetical protein